jgi:GTPase SAR1 family protein
MKEEDKEELKIIPYTGDEKPKFKHKIPEVLPDKTFSCILVGSSGAGKSVVIRNLIRIMGKNIKKPNRFLFQSTIKDDSTLINKFNEECIFEKYYDDIYKGILSIITKENQTRYEKKKRPEEFLLVVDDMIGLIKNNSVIWSEFVRNRHAHLNILLSVQKFRSIPPVARYNSTCYIVFSSINRKELKAITEELNKKFPNNLFENKFLEKVKGYNFLYINTKKQEYLINFTDPLISEEELKDFLENK